MVVRLRLVLLSVFHIPLTPAKLLSTLLNYCRPFEPQDLKTQPITPKNIWVAHMKINVIIDKTYELLLKKILKII